LLLATLGVYGVMAYMVTGRTREIAVRLVLGAKTWDIARLVLGQGMLVVLIGTLVGFFASLALKRPLGALLFGVSATDPWTLAAVAGLLVVVAVAACCIPLRKAMSVSPVTTLHRE
jgi:ABC-type antimicrobial peptide transport system permease subunit